MSTAFVAAEKLLQAGAVQISLQNPFTWASGWKSPIYCDNRKLLSHPHVRDYIKNELATMVIKKFPEPEVIAGVATAGISWGSLVADQLRLPFVYVRPKPKEHGLGKQIEGFSAAGQRVVVIEDLISTGKSGLQAVEALRAADLVVLGLVSIFSYGFEDAVNAMLKANVEAYSLTFYTDLLNLQLSKGLISESEIEVLLKWRLNPSGWIGMD